MSRKAGRPPKPVELKLIEGNRGKRKLALPPKAPPSRPNCPAWLSTYAKTEWRYIVPVLDELGLLTKLDRMVLAGACDAAADFRRATEELEKSPSLLVKGGGRISKNPLIQIKRDARRDVLAFSSALGLSPSDRVRLLGAAGPPSGKSALYDILTSEEA
jgi:P27 family predicted phage terminase small subunit